MIFPHVLLTDHKNVSLFRLPFSPGRMVNTAIYGCENSMKNISDVLGIYEGLGK